MTRAAKLPFASSYFFEFLTGSDGTDYVKTVFRDDKGRTTDVKLACSVSDSDTACEKLAFKSFVSDRLALAESVSCDQDYSSDVEHTYADIDAYTAQLLKDIGLPDETTDSSTTVEHEHPTADSILGILDALEGFFGTIFGLQTEDDEMGNARWIAGPTALFAGSYVTFQVL